MRECYKCQCNDCCKNEDLCSGCLSCDANDQFLEDNGKEVPITPFVVNCEKFSKY